MSSMTELKESGTFKEADDGVTPLHFSHFDTPGQRTSATNEDFNRLFRDSIAKLEDGIRYRTTPVLLTAA